MANIENEIWKEVTVNPNYLVSNLGRVKAKARLINCHKGFRNKKEHLLKPQNNHGYYNVAFLVNGKHKRFLVHRLVMYAFKEERPYPEWEIDHINGNSLDNRLENLEYVKSSENTRRAYTLNLQDKRVLSLANNKRIANPEQIVYIKQQFVKEGRVLKGRKNRDFYQRMAQKFGYKDPQSIYKILLGCTNRFFGENIVQTTN